MPPRSKDNTGDTPPAPVARPRRRRTTVVEDEFRQWATGAQLDDAPCPPPVDPGGAVEPAAEAPIAVPGASAGPDVPPGAVLGAQDGSGGHAVVMAGTFVIYDDGKGGLVLVVTDPEGNVTRKHIPAAVVGMARGGGLMGRMFGLKGLMG